MSNILKKDFDICCTDVLKIEFNVTYSNDTKIKKSYFTSGNVFTDVFTNIKSIILDLEFVTAVLLTDKDYEEKQSK